MISRMVVALAVGLDVGLRVPGWLELLFRVQRSLVEPVRRTGIARFAELKNRLHLRLRRQLDGPDEGMAGDAIAALLARLRQRVEIEDDAQGPRCAGDRQTRLIVAKRTMALHVDLRAVDPLQTIDLAPGHFPGASRFLQVRQGRFQRANAWIIQQVPLRDHLQGPVIRFGKQRHRDGIDGADAVPTLEQLDRLFQLGGPVRLL